MTCKPTGRHNSFSGYIINQYLNEIQSDDVSTSSEKLQPPKKVSPYATNVKKSSGKFHKIKKKTDFELTFSSNDETSDPETMIQKITNKKPAMMKNEKSTVTPNSIRSKRKKSKLFKFINDIKRAKHITAFRNGTHDRSVELIGLSVEDFLTSATDKLKLTNPARKLFLESGKQLTNFIDIPDGADVFVSQGENFKDAKENYKKMNILQKSASWSLYGIKHSDENPRGGTTPVVSKRISDMLDKDQKRVLIIRNRNNHLSAEIVAEKDKWESFLNSASIALGCTSPAQKAFDYHGKKVNSINETPRISKLLLPNYNAPLLGPLWISTGESFSHLCCEEYLQNIIKKLTSEIKASKSAIRQMELALNEDTKDDVTSKEFLSFSDDDLYAKMTETSDHCDDLKALRSEFHEIIKSHSVEINKERMQPCSYAYQHIRELPSNHRLTGHSGLKLQVYENGTNHSPVTVFFNIKEATRGLRGDPNRILEKFLDHCVSCSEKLANPRHATYSTKPQKLFDENGKEITNVVGLGLDQKVWLSFGEPFISCNERGIELVCYTVTAAIDSDDGTVLSLHKGPQYIAPKSCSYDFKSDFIIVPEWSQDFSVNSTDSSDESSLIPKSSTFIISKIDSSLVLYPNFEIVTKKERGNNSMWPPNAQSFSLSKKGVIYCRSFTQLCLGLSANPTESEGYFVTAEKRNANDFDQQWLFTEYGNIVSKSNHGLYLSDNSSNQLLSASTPTNNDSQTNQQWALRSESSVFHKLLIPNSEWHKRGYFWPVDNEGDYVKDMEWPIMVNFVFGAPRLKVVTQSSSNSSRYLIVRNGDFTSKPTKIACPAVEKIAVGKGRRNIEKKSERAFHLFLDICSRTLDLPGAARRVFDKNGAEYLTLVDLPHGEPVYISCGENFVNSRSTGNDEHRSTISNISSDLQLMEQFLQLRYPIGLSLEVEDFAINAKLKVRATCMDSEQRWLRKKPKTPSPPPPPVETLEEMLARNSPHFRSHYRSDELHKLQQSPWKHHCSTCKDNAANNCSSEDVLVEEANSLLNNVKKSQKYSDSKTVQRQSFSYSDGFIFCKSKPLLVLGVKGSEVFLCQKRDDDANQRWNISSNGVIHLKSDADRALTVFTPTHLRTNDDRKQTTNPYIDCSVIIAQTIRNEFGGAHQRWNFDQVLGIIDAFASATLDKEVTAANKVGICTAAVSKEKIDQIGYQLDAGYTAEAFCYSCARSIRAQYKITKITKRPNKFICALGEDSKGLGLKNVGSFKRLNGKVDLSTFEAQRTVDLWCERLNSLHRMMSTKVVESTISAYFVPPTVKLNVRKNGNGYKDKPTLIFGTTFQGLLENAAYQLGLSFAARKFYSCDGNSFLSIKDIISWSMDCFARKSNCRLIRDASPVRKKEADEALACGDIKRSSSSDSIHISSDAEETNSSQDIDRPQAPVPQTNLMQNSDFEKTSASGLPTEWISHRGSTLELEYEHEYGVNILVASRRVKSDSGIAQLLTNRLEFGRRYKLMLVAKICTKIKDIDSIFSSRLIYRTETQTSPQEIPIISCKLEEELTLLMGHLCMPYNAYAKLEDARLILVTNVPQNSFGISNAVLTEDQPNTNFRENLLDNAEFDSLNAQSPSFWHPLNRSNLEVDETEMISFCTVSCNADRNAGISQDITHKLKSDTSYILKVELASSEKDCEIKFEIIYASDIEDLKSLQIDSKKLSSKDIWEDFECEFHFHTTIQSASFVLMSNSPGCSFRFRGISLKQLIKRHPSNDVEELQHNIREIHVNDIDVNTVLRTPVDVWVSMGEPFIPIEESSDKSGMSEELLSAGVALGVQKHRLRVIQGQRRANLNSAVLTSTQNPQQPVQLKGGWKEPLSEEIEIQKKINQLEADYENIRQNVKQDHRQLKTKCSNNLAKQPLVKRINVYRNGDDPDRAVTTWGSSLEMLLQGATDKLALRSIGRILYNTSGIKINSFEELEKYQVYSVSQGEPFVAVEDLRRKCQIKAQWGRDRREKGKDITDSLVSVSINQKAKVDPLTPPQCIQSPRIEDLDSSQDCVFITREIN